MRSVLRFTLLGICAAAGLGLAVGLALRLDPPNQRTPIGQEPPSFRAKPTSEQVGAPGDFPVPDERGSRAASSSENAIGAAGKGAASAPLSATTFSSPPPSSAAPVETPSQLTMAHQMGRLEEKLRRAEEFAERRQQSLETALAAFQKHHEETAARAAVLRRQQAERLPDDLDALPLLNGAEDHAEPPARSSPPETLPPPASNSAQILPDEGDGLLTVNFKNSDLRQVLDLLSEQHGMNIIASPTVQGKVTAKLTNVDVDTALDAVLKATGFVARRQGNVIYVATPAEFITIDQAHDHINTRIYRPNYVTAAELQQLLTPLITEGVGVISVNTAAKIGIPSDNTEAGGDSFSGADVVLVQDYESVLKRIDQLLLEVDVRPLQVAIEAMIVTVTLDDTNEMGVNFALLTDDNDGVIISGGRLRDLATIPEGGLKFGFLESSVAAFIEALETVGDTNVVAAPRVMALNKQRAEVLIGAQLGYVSTTVTENAATQSVEFLEVGTQLRIRPFISSDGTIRLEVHPELSTGEVDVRDGFTLPNKSVTQVTTNIMCPDGATVVIGGLIREDLSSNTTQIPVLGALPLVGAAFRQRREELFRTETIVLLTPRVISGPTAAAEGAQGKAEFLRRQEVRYDKMNPLAQRYYGKQYLRKARAAWNAGDASAALRYANLAIHFDPENREAINLRSEIVAASGVGDRSIETRLREGLAPWSHPLREYSHHGVPWETYEPAEVYVEPPDPGVPGKIGNLEPPHAQHEPIPLNPLRPPPAEEVPAAIAP